jgi:hypothetical protein
MGDDGDVIGALRRIIVIFEADGITVVRRMVRIDNTPA